ncbi:MAG: hypothetical protein M3N08_05830 [Pseudomonadota bacterium]|nr:hypothetical protein [Pseudomonadota bacterium]
MIRPGHFFAASLASIIFLGSLPTSSVAATVFYSNDATFLSATPAAEVLDLSGLANGVYANGLTLSDVTFATLSPVSTSQALIVSAGRIGNNTFGDTLSLAFGPDVTAFGTNVLNAIAEPGGPVSTAPITEDVYSSTTLVGQQTITESSGFFGVSSTAPITKITFISECESDCSTLLSNISVNAPVSDVPLPEALPLFAAALVAFGLLNWRRNKRSA